MNSAPLPYWLFIVGAWPIWFVIVWAIWNSRRTERDAKLVERSLAWPEAQGIVITSKVVWAHVEVAYEYHALGATYTGKYEMGLEPVAPGGLSGMGAYNREARQGLNQYPSGVSLIIRYNPLNPSESVLYCRAPSGSSEISRSDSARPLAPTPAQISPERNPTKVLVIVACSLLIFIGFLAAANIESQRAAKRERLNREQEQLRRNLAIERLHSTDLKPLYDQINHDSFEDRLPSDTKVAWSNHISARECNPCDGMTTWDARRGPEIWVNKTVTTEKELLEVLQHEMCHVGLIQWQTDDEKDQHGPAFQECMERFH